MKLNLTVCSGTIVAGEVVRESASTETDFSPEEQLTHYQARKNRTKPAEQNLIRIGIGG
jgi:hypothetical protein